MKKIFAVAAVVAAFSTGVAFAASSTPAVSVEKQMQDLKKLVGAGEISSKEYNKRIAALRESASAQQTAETKK